MRTVAELLEQETPKQNGSNKVGVYFSFTYQARGKQNGAAMVILPFAAIHRPRCLLSDCPSFLQTVTSSSWLNEAG